MNPSQISGLEFGQAELEGAASAIAALVRQEIASYGRLEDSAVHRDLVRIVRRNLELYLTSLRTATVPAPGQLTEFEEVCGCRLRQGLPLEAVLRAGRIENQAMWQLVSTRVPPERLPELATLTMRYMDAISVASERGYIHARDDLGRSVHEATRLFLTRVIRGDFADEAEAAREARLLDLDLDRFRVGVVIVGERTPGVRRSGLDLKLAEAAAQLHTALAGSPWGLDESGLVLAPATTAPGDVARLVADVLDRLRPAEPWLMVGIGLPRAGSGGLGASFAEARRALALGSVLDPGRRVHRYDELRVFDLFKEDGTLDSFVREVLGPLLARDRQRRTRMVETLAAYFASGMVRKAAAAQLGIHPNTLDYRLKEIEELLGYSVHTGSDAFKLQLAIKLLPLAARSQSGASND